MDGHFPINMNSISYSAKTKTQRFCGIGTPVRASDVALHSAVSQAQTKMPPAVRRVAFLFVPFQCSLTISLTFISWLVVERACSSSFIEMYLMVSA